MKYSKLYTHLGITSALLVPALAVAAIEVPNVFKGGDPVSASQMNENFQVMAEAIDDRSKGGNAREFWIASTGEAE